MTTSQLIAWSHGVGANPAHPTSWTPAQRQSYQAYKLRLAQDHFRWYARMNPRSYIDRAALIDEVRQDALEALKPPVARPWRECGCAAHARRYVNAPPQPPVPRAEALDYIRTFAPQCGG